MKQWKRIVTLLLFLSLCFSLSMFAAEGKAAEKQVFKQDPGGYARENAYWRSYSIRDLVNVCDENAQKDFLDRIEKLKKVYAQMSEVYQKNKGDTDIPLK